MRANRCPTVCAAFILWILGWIVRYGARMSLIAGVLAIGHVLNWRRLEEEKFVAVYGEEYRKYQQKNWF